MVGTTKSNLGPQTASRRFLNSVRFLPLLVLTLATLTARAEFQFDAFLGYDSIVPETSWFPLVCEIKNDGPPFLGVVEVTGQAGDGQVLRVPIELPTGTLKRLVIPLFSGARGYGTWDARLFDEHNRLRAEQTALRPRKQASAEAPLIGGLPRTVNGVPSLRPVLQQDRQPMVARLQTSLFPDDPIVMAGLDAVYLNSEKAPELKVNQVNALLEWLNAGGHLIVAVEQISDVAGTPWLRAIFPAEVKDLQPVTRHPELQSWLQSATWSTNVTYGAAIRPGPGGMNRSRPANVPAPGPFANIAQPFGDLAEDPAFEAAEMQVAVGPLRDGVAVVSAGETPLVVSAHRGRGKITVLLFSPEREPFRSWKNLPTFWAKVTDIPGGWYVSNAFGGQSGWSSDGIFGAMIDSRQVHKLPVGWLLLLLIVYLVIIGPLDQYWLKRIGKPMLTWITFPCYVVLFSLLIYFIGYKLRAGESEWSELHLVDVLLNGDHAELRGQTYTSIYSPANEKYVLQGHQQFAALRGEFAGPYGGGGGSSEKMNVVLTGDTFKADVFVPVWTSQLLVSDWWQPASLPLSASVEAKGTGWEVKVDNKTDRNLSTTRVVIDGTLMELGEVAANSSKTFTVSKAQGTQLKRFVANYGSTFQTAVQSRQRTFGGNENWRIDDLPNATVAASFLSQLNTPENPMMVFSQPTGLDLSGVADRGNAILLAWAADYSPVKSLYQFSPRRSHRNTLWRFAVPLQ